MGNNEEDNILKSAYMARHDLATLSDYDSGLLIHSKDPIPDIEDFPQV